MALAHADRLRHIGRFRPFPVGHAGGGGHYASDVVRSLWQPGGGTADQIIWNIRLPRTLTGALVGANLALSGAILQAVMRNPLADPHIIGISSGAGLFGSSSSSSSRRTPF